MDTEQNKNAWLGIVGLLILAVAFQAEARTSPGPGGTAVGSKARLVESYGRLPLSFELNQGQTDNQVRFLSRGPGYSVFLTPTEAVLALGKTVANKADRSKNPAIPGKAEGGDPESTEIQKNRDWMPASAGMRQSRIDADHKPAQTATLRMQLVGANPKPRISGVAELPGKVNYFRGNDPKKWRTNVPTYAKVKYENVYPGIDLVYYGNQRRLEHDFVVAPGADPGTIRLAFAGAEKIAIDGHGDLVLKTAGGDVRLRKPRVYQDINGQQREIEGRYVLRAAKKHGKPQIGFQVAAYKKDEPLIIDPVLFYATYLGGSNEEFGTNVAVDSAGNAYVTGRTSSTDFPTGNPVQGVFGGVQDIFVAKLNANGSALVYSTYLGGSNVEFDSNVAVDSAGNAYVTGETDSTDFPTVNPLQSARRGASDIFVAKLNANGSALVYSTYLGGTGDESGFGISVAVDSAGNAYVTGPTFSTNFPTVNPVQGVFGGFADAFVAKLNASGSALVYSTYLGGSDYDQGFDIAVDSAGNAYVTGGTASTDFPAANPLQVSLSGAFVAKLNANGSALVYSTRLGAWLPYGIAVDSAGNAYMSGLTSSTDLPTVNPVQGVLAGSRDDFVAKLNASGSALVYSTYLGGTGDESGLLNGDIAVDSAGNAYVTGLTSSTDFPTVNPVQGVLAGSRDDFVAKLNASGSALVYSTYLGGTGDESQGGIAVDSAGNAYVTGSTASTDFPTVNPVQGVFGGVQDAFVVKISDTAPPPPQPVLSVTPNGLDFGTVAVGSSKDLELTVKNTGEGTLTGTASTSPPFSIVSGGSFTLGAGASQTVVVRFSPTATGSFSGNVSFTSNGGDATHIVTGTGETAPAISVTPTILDFGSVAVGSSADRTLTVQNEGGGTLTGTCSTIAPFSLPSGCAFNLTSGQSADVTVRFSPTGQGVFGTPVDLTSNAGNASLALNGIGVVPNNKQPVIKGSPNSAVPGDKVTLFGRNFGPVGGQLIVGGQTVVPSSWNDTFIEFIVPNLSPGLYDIIVNTSGGQAKTTLEILPPATKIVDIRPKSGAPGSTVIIDGHNFGAQQGTSIVTVGNIVSEVAFWADKRIGIKIPSTLGLGIQPVEINTPSGVATASFRIRNLVLVPEYGACDELFINLCPAIVPSVTRERQNGTVIDIGLENNQDRWYEVTVTPVGASIPGNTTFILGPHGVKKISNVSLVQGANISFFADGTTINAVWMLEVDLIFRFATGRHFPQDLAEAAVTGIRLAAPLAAFFDDLRVALSNNDRIAALLTLRRLPGLAQDPIVRDILRTYLKLTAQQVAKIDDLGQAIRLTSLIAETLVIVNSPRFGTAALVAR